MSIFNIAKGTEFEDLARNLMQAEANGTIMYYALARLAKEQGYDDIAPIFIEAANQEAVHAGFYATLIGKYPQNFWRLVRGLEKAETCGEVKRPSRTRCAQPVFRRQPMRWKSSRVRKDITAS